MSGKNERALSEKLAADFPKRECLTVTEYGVRIHDAWKRIDVAAVKWGPRMSFEASAVEVKDAHDWFDAGDALNQALAYQCVFPSVYLASPVPESELYHIEPILRQLGLGYIEIRDPVPIERIEPSPQPPNRFNREQFLSQVKAKLGLYWAAKTACDDYRMGQYQKESVTPWIDTPWIGGRFVRRSPTSKENSSLNYLVRLLPDSNKIRYGVNLEFKSDIERFFTRCTEEEFLRVLGQLPDTTVLTILPFILYNDRKMPFSQPDLEEPICNDPISEVNNVGHIYDGVTKFRFLVWFFAHVEEQSDLENESIEEHQGRIEGMENAFAPLYDLIASKIAPRSVLI